MAIITIPAIQLIGLSLKNKTSNVDGKSSLDCINLWHEFHKMKYAEQIKDKLSNEIYGVYHDHEGDSSKPFSYFIGYKVKHGTAVPAGLKSLLIPAGSYQKVTVSGVLPDAMVAGWQEIIGGQYPRAHTIDFEVYDDRSKDWGNGTVDIFLSLKPNDR